MTSDQFKEIMEKLEELEDRFDRLEIRLAEDKVTSADASLLIAARKHKQAVQYERRLGDDA